MRHKKEFFSILIRYLSLLILALPNLWIFYFIFTPLTVYPVYFILKLFFETTLINGNVVLINNAVPIEMIRACIAGSAYYLLLILNLSTSGINLKKRINMIALSFLSLLIVNILRIIFLAIIFIDGFSWFVLTHEFFWYFMSTIFVVGIWFAEIKIFSVKEKPFYSDVKFLYKHSKFMK